MPMTSDDKRAAGWVETSPGHWRIPDAAPVRDDSTGYGPGRAVTRRAANGQTVAVYPDGWRTTLREARNGAPIVVTREQRAARVAVIIARARLNRKRQRAAILADVLVTLAQSGDTHRRAPILTGNGDPFRYLHGPRKGQPITRRESVRVIARSLKVEGFATHLASADDATALESARWEYRKARAPERMALRRATQARNVAAKRAAETPEQREARLAANRERMRALRAARKCAAQ